MTSGFLNFLAETLTQIDTTWVLFFYGTWQLSSIKTN